MVINKLIYNRVFMEAKIPRIPLRGHNLHREFLETYRNSRFSVVYFDACLSKDCYFIFPFAFLVFFLLFIKIFVFYYFHFFSWWSIKFPQQNINQLETIIFDKKLSVELYVRVKQSMWSLCLNFEMRKFTLPLNQSY